MPRKIAWGTPGGRSPRYFFPRPAWTRLVRAAVLGATALGLFGMLELGGRFVFGLRAPLMPGPLIARHSIETGERCEACHDGGRATNFRCQRCHDEAGPGRMSHVAHVGRHFERLSRSDPRTAESVHDLECARCHVEHRGTQGRAARRLVASRDGQCVVCHGKRRSDDFGERPAVSGFGAEHPEFAVLRAGAGEPGLIGVYFSHREHVAQVEKELQKKRPGASGGDQACRECHDLATGQPGHRAFGPVTAEAHCLGCHHHSSKHLKTQPVSARDVDDPGTACGKEFRCDGGTVERLGALHRDPWIRRQLDRLRRELHPEEHDSEYAELLARAWWLKRRLFLAEPIAGLSSEALERRRQDFRADQTVLAERIAQRERRTPASPRQRVEDVARALSAAGVADGGLRSQLEALGADRPLPSPQSAADFEARRSELLDLADAVLAVETDLASPLRRRASTLRLRLLSALPGEGAGAGLERALRQRRQDTARVEDELWLRRSGVSASQLGPDASPMLRALAATVSRLNELRALGDVQPGAPDERARKQESLRALVGEDHASGCAKCHVIRKGTIQKTAPARPVLTLSSFAHEPHLRASPPRPALLRRLLGRGPAGGGAAAGSCASCHAGMLESEQAEDLHLAGIESCRACHGAGQSEDCQQCHRYHPPPRP